MVQYLKGNNTHMHCYVFRFFSCCVCFQYLYHYYQNLVTMVLCYGDNQNSTKYQGKSNTHHQLLIQPSEPHHFHSFYQRLNIRTLPKYQVILWFLPHTFGCSEVIFLSQTLPHTLIWIILYHDLPQLWLLSLCTQFCVSRLFLSCFHDTE